MGLFSLVVVAIDNVSTTGTYSLPTQGVYTRAATTSEIAAFPTALTAVVVPQDVQNNNRAVIYLSSTATATVNTAINAAAAGVLGSGVSGQTTLVAGTKAITITGLTTSNLGFVQLVSPSSASSTIQYKAVCTANTLTITALVAAGTINASDVSTVNYAILG